jgi:hypothetical protein
LPTIILFAPFFERLVITVIELLSPGRHRKHLAVLRTQLAKRLVDISLQLIGYGFSQGLGIDWLVTHSAVHKIEIGNLIPCAGKQAFEFHRVLGAYPPAIAATGAKRHVVLNRPALGVIIIFQGTCRAVLHTGQTAIAFTVNLKKRHITSPYAKHACAREY